MKATYRHLLSVIIPVYRGEKYIKKNLKVFYQSINQLKKERNFNFEIIVVIDGEVDDSLNEAKKVSKIKNNIKVVSYPENKGKGYALSRGFEASKGELITFIDGDGDFPPAQIANFFPYIATADLIVGSKRHPFSSLFYPLNRRILSLGFQILSKLILGINIRDSQSGLKLIKREVLEVILPCIKILGYGFDIELCFLAQKHGFRIVEAPIHINFQTGGSNINKKIAFIMLKDLFAIRYRYTFKKNYQKKFHSKYFKIN